MACFIVEFSVPFFKIRTHVLIACADQSIRMSAVNRVFFSLTIYISATRFYVYYILEFLKRIFLNILFI